MPQDVGVGPDRRARSASCCSRRRPRALREAGARMLAPSAAGRGRRRRAPGWRWARRSATGPSSAATSSRASGTRPAGGSCAPGSTRSAARDGARSPAASASGSCSTCCSPPTPPCCCSTSPTTSSTSRPSARSSSRSAASTKTILLISHDRELLTRRLRRDRHARGRRRWVHGGSYAHLPRGARASASSCSATPRALEGRGAAPVRALMKIFKERAALLDGLGQEGRRRRDALAALRRRRPAARAGRRPADPGAPARRRLRAPRRSTCATVAIDGLVPAVRRRGPLRRARRPDRPQRLAARRT